MQGKGIRRGSTGDGQTEEESAREEQLFLNNCIAVGSGKSVVLVMAKFGSKNVAVHIVALGALRLVVEIGN